MQALHLKNSSNWIDCTSIHSAETFFFFSSAYSAECSPVICFFVFILTYFFSFILKIIDQDTVWENHLENEKKKHNQIYEHLTMDTQLNVRELTLKFGFYTSAILGNVFVHFPTLIISRCSNYCESNNVAKYFPIISLISIRTNCFPKIPNYASFFLGKNIQFNGKTFDWLELTLTAWLIVC